LLLLVVTLRENCILCSILFCASIVWDIITDCALALAIKSTFALLFATSNTQKHTHPHTQPHTLTLHATVCCIVAHKIEMMKLLKIEIVMSKFNDYNL